MSLSKGAFVILLVALGTSVLLNIGGAYLYLQQRDVAAASRAQLDGAKDDAEEARAVAQACSASVDALFASARVLAQQLEGAREAAQKRAVAHYGAADKILSTSAVVPGDECSSARALVRQIMVDKGKGGG